MELLKDKGKIAELAGGKGVLLSKGILLAAELADKEEVTVLVEVTEAGQKRIVIEETPATRETLLEELVGIVELPENFDLKEVRREGIQKRY